MVRRGLHPIWVAERTHSRRIPRERGERLMKAGEPTSMPSASARSPRYGDRRRDNWHTPGRWRRGGQDEWPESEKPSVPPLRMGCSEDCLRGSPRVESRVWRDQLARHVSDRAATTARPSRETARQPTEEHSGQHARAPRGSGLSVHSALGAAELWKPLFHRRRLRKLVILSASNIQTSIACLACGYTARATRFVPSH